MVDLTRVWKGLSLPTWIKVKRKWLLPATLDHYRLPWEWDKDSEYIVIKKYVDEELQDRLFKHTRRLKKRKMITGPIKLRKKCWLLIAQRKIRQDLGIRSGYRVSETLRASEDRRPDPLLPGLRAD